MSVMVFVRGTECIYRYSQYTWHTGAANSYFRVWNHVCSTPSAKYNPSLQMSYLEGSHLCLGQDVAQAVVIFLATKSAANVNVYGTVREHLK